MAKSGVPGRKIDEAGVRAIVRTPAPFSVLA